MKRMKNLIVAFWKDEQGQDLIEYSLVLAFVGLASAAFFTDISPSVSKVWVDANTTLSKAVVAAS
jgi:Flp pilus assembly pilin Flp